MIRILYFFKYFFLKYSKLYDELKLDIIQHMNIHNKRVWDPKDAALCLYTGMTQIDLHVQHKALYISMNVDSCMYESIIIESYKNIKYWYVITIFERDILLIQLIIHDIFRLSLTILHNRELEKIKSFSILSFFFKVILILEHNKIY